MKELAIVNEQLAIGASAAHRGALAAEASKNLENVAIPPTRWIAAVSAAEEILTTKNTKNAKNTKKELRFHSKILKKTLLPF